LSFKEGIDEEESGNSVRNREVVTPGEELYTSEEMYPGDGVDVENGSIYSTILGMKSINSGYVNILPLNTVYMPIKGDQVIGSIVNVKPMNWLVDINAPELLSLHVSSVPWNVDYGDTERFLKVGDAVILKIVDVNSLNRMEATMKGRGLRKLNKGFILRINPAKVPRLIGKGGSMISLIRGYTQCKLFVAQNGLIWIKGRSEMVPRIKHVVDMVEERAHHSGLTDKVKSYLMDLAK